MLRSELFKLSKDRYLIVILIFIVIYLFSGYLLANPNAKDFYQTANISTLLSDQTIDTAFMIMLIGLVSAAAFAGEFSIGTIKNVLIYNSRKKVYFLKVISIAIAVFTMLLIWYVCGLIYVSVSRSQIPNIVDFYNYFLRFSVQYFIILLQTSLITIVSIIFGKRAIANISTVIFWMAITFIPIKGKMANEFLEQHYKWGNVPNYKLYLILITACVIIYFVGFIMFKNKEIKN